MNDYYYKVSLRITHPSLDLKDTCGVLGLSPRHCWKAGDQRRTPKGELLDDVYSESYWTASLITEEHINSTDQTLDIFLNKLNNRFSDHKELFKEITGAGGRVSYFIGLFGGNNIGLILSPNLLKSTAKLTISIELDVYD